MSSSNRFIADGTNGLELIWSCMILRVSNFVPSHFERKLYLFVDISSMLLIAFVWIMISNFGVYTLVIIHSTDCCV